MSRKISKLNSDKFKCFCDRMFPLFMLLMIDGNYEIDELIEHVFYDFGYLICLRHLFLSRAATNLIFLLLLHTRAEPMLVGV